MADVECAYDEYQFYKANQALISYANSDLSASTSIWPKIAST